MKTLLTLYRAALRLYPAVFRRDFGSEMARDFADGCRDARISRRLPAYLMRVCVERARGLWITTAPKSASPP